MRSLSQDVATRNTADTYEERREEARRRFSRSMDGWIEHNLGYASPWARTLNTAPPRKRRTVKPTAEERRRLELLKRTGRIR